MTRSDLESKIRKFCSNMVYIFIPDDMLKTTKYFGRHTAGIYNKRSRQINYLSALSVEANMAGSLDDIRDWIRDEIAKTYEPLYNPKTKKKETATPELIIYHLSIGDEINGMNWDAGIYGRCGVGASAPVTDFGSGTGVTLNPTTGEFNVGGSVVSGITTYKANGTTPKTVAYYDAATGQTYTAKYKKSTGMYSAYSVSNSSGKVTKVGGGTLTALNADVWENINNLLGNINEIISTFASFLSGESATALSPSQVDDGWVEPESSTSAGGVIGTAAILGAGILAAGVVLNKDKKGKKQKKTNKEA